MGRGKLPMGLIANEKSRNTTYHKRKRGLKKKLHEFTTLCGVAACMIIYGPYQGNRPMELDTWPSKSEDVKSVISKYKSKGEDSKSKRTSNISDFFENRRHKIDDDLMKLRRANAKAKFPRWDNRFNHAPLDKLITAVNSMDNKISDAKNLIKVMKENQRLMKGGAPIMIDYTNTQSNQIHSVNNYGHNMFPLNMQLIDQSNNILAPVSTPLDVCVPPNYAFNQNLHIQPSSFDLNPAPNPMMMMKMMMMNGDCTRFGGGFSSSNVDQYNPLINSVYYDPTAGMVQNNVMYKQSSGTSTGYDSLSMQQPLQQFEDRPMESNVSQMVMMPSTSNLLGTQVNDYFDFDDFQPMNKRARIQPGFEQGF